MPTCDYCGKTVRTVKLDYALASLYYGCAECLRLPIHRVHFLNILHYLKDGSCSARVFTFSTRAKTYQAASRQLLLAHKVRLKRNPNKPAHSDTYLPMTPDQEQAFHAVYPLGFYTFSYVDPMLKAYHAMQWRG